MARTGWNGVLFVQEGYYATAILRFVLQFSSTSDQTPILHFIPVVLHPLIDPRGAVDLGDIWKGLEGPGKGSKVLKWIERLFERATLDNLSATDCVRKEVYELYVY